MYQANTILIVDDDKTNRDILKNLLVKNDFCTLEAVNGAEGLEILKQNYQKIIAIFLDYIMPVMNGFEFLQEVKKEPQLLSIPVIVNTSHTESREEAAALRSGAWDFIAKPFEPEVILFRLRNVLDRSEYQTKQALLYLTEYDTLTGLPNRNNFLQQTKQMLESNQDTKFSFIRFDIDRFSLINAHYGFKEGNKVLCFIADELRKLASSGKKYTIGRIRDDIFAFCLELNCNNDDFTEATKLLEAAINILKGIEKDYYLIPSIGIYRIPNNSISADQIYNRATLASKTCKGSYTKLYAWYHSDMEEQLKKDQEIAKEMESALNSNQFVPYLQPKYDLKTNKVVGAEALIRWIHPNKGLIPPGAFIPVFERNGFISKVDFFMWESICKIIRSWIDSNKTIVPISVNISPVDLHIPNIADSIIELVEKYKIPHDLINFEITETVCMDNPILMLQIIKRLQENGFLIMMDDFGSGNSSLSVLKDNPVNVLKIDMKFLEKCQETGKSESIIASVVQMARNLNIPVIAEGAETFEQVQFLKTIGCNFVQGYYFSRPIEQKQFEELVYSEYGNVGFDIIKKLESPNINAEDFFFSKEFWAEASVIERNFTELRKPAAIYSYENGIFNLLRVNDLYFKLFDFTAVPGQAQQIIKAITTCALTGKKEKEKFTYKFQNGTEQEIDIEMEFLLHFGSKQIVLGVFSL